MYLENIELWGSGWKNPSLVDVYHSVTFTIWLCGCNLKCPFCHNWRLAINDKNTCGILHVDSILDELDRSCLLLDYVHVTGGEPLLQWRSLRRFFRIVKESIGVRISINSNLTLYKPITILLKDELVDHIATDVKIPPELMYGLPCSVSKKLWELFMKSLRHVVENNVVLELRIPVARNIDINYYREYISKLVPVLDRCENIYFVVQPLLGRPLTSPRNIEWCSKYCDPPENILDQVRAIIREQGFNRVYVRDLYNR